LDPSVHQILTNVLDHTRTTVSEASTTEKDASDITFSSDIYVALEAGTLWGQDYCDLEGRMNSFLAAEDQKVLVIVGDPGAGKTTFAKRWLQTLLKDKPEAYEHNSAVASGKAEKDEVLSDYLPIFIVLNGIFKRGAAPETMTQTLGNLLEEHIEARNTGHISFDKLKGKEGPTLLVFLDGYDEIPHQDNLYDDNEWHEWPNVKFVITTRPETFSASEDRGVVQQAIVEALAPRGKPSNAFSIAHIRELRDAQIKIIIQQWSDKLAPETSRTDSAAIPAQGKQEDDANEWDADRYWTTLSSTEGLRELATNPTVLRLILSALPDMAKAHEGEETAAAKQQTRLGVYKQFVDTWFKQRVNPTDTDKSLLAKLKRKDKTDLDTKFKRHAKGLYPPQANDEQTPSEKLWFAYLQRYTQNLAYYCFMGNGQGKFLLEIESDKTLDPILLNDRKQQDPFVASLTLEQRCTLLEVLRSGCLLKCEKEKHYFRFFHKSIVEFFTEEHLFRGAVGLVEIMGDLMAEQTGAHTNPEVVERLKHLGMNEKLLRGEANLLRFLAEQSLQDKTFENTLLKMINLSKTNLDLETAAANAITILNQAHYPLTTLDLKGIRISGADLSNAILEKVDFTGAQLNRVEFSGAYLPEANFSNASLKDTQWGTVDQIRVKGNIRDFVFTQDGAWLLVGCEFGRIYKVDTTRWAIEIERKPPIAWSAKSHHVTSMAVDGHPVEYPKSTCLATGTTWGAINLWQLPELNKVGSLDSHQTEVQALAFSPASPHLASASADELIEWDLESKKPAHTLNTTDYTVRALCYTPSGEALGLQCSDDTIKLWDRGTHSITQVFSASNLTFQQFVFECSTNPGEYPLESLIRSAQALDKGKVILPPGITYRGLPATTPLQLWDRDKQEVARNLPGGKSEDPPQSIAFSPRGKHYATHHTGNRLNLYNLSGAGIASEFEGHTHTVYSVAFSPEGHTLASGSYDYTIRLWDTTTGNTRTTLEEHINIVTSVALSPDGHTLASGNEQHTIRLWETTTGKRRITLEGHSHVVCSLAFSPEGHTLASGGFDHTIRLWETTTGKIKATLGGHSRTVYSLAFSPDGHTLASGSEDYTIRLWDTTSGLAKAILEGHTEVVYSLAFSPEGHTLASGSRDKTIRLWETTTGKLRTTLEGHNNDVTTLTFSPDGHTLASGSHDKTIRLWDTTSGQSLETLAGRGYVISALRFEGHHSLQVGGRAENACQAFTYELSPTPQSRPSRLSHLMHRAAPIKNLNLHHCQGLSKAQFQFLSTQGAAGKPRQFAMQSSDVVDVEEEERKLADVRNLLAELKVDPTGADKQVPSLFPGKRTLQVSHGLWQVTLFRVTNSQFPPTTNLSQSNSGSDRHVYAVFEGLDVFSRRVWIRVDYFTVMSEKPYARVSCIPTVAKDNSDQAAKNAFMELFKDSRTVGTPYEITYHPAGCIPKEAMLDIIETLMAEQQKQYCDDDKVATTRLRYALLGGGKTVDGPHNCLTWLQAHLQHHSALTFPAPPFTTRFFTDPKSVLSPKACTVEDVRTWDRDEDPSAAAADAGAVPVHQANLR